MDKYFIVTEETRKEIMVIENSIKSEFPRLIMRVTRDAKSGGWLISISGTDNDVLAYIDRLVDGGIPLDT